MTFLKIKGREGEKRKKKERKERIKEVWFTLYETLPLVWRRIGRGGGGGEEEKMNERKKDRKKEKKQKETAWTGKAEIRKE